MLRASWWKKIALLLVLIATGAAAAVAVGVMGGKRGVGHDVGDAGRSGATAVANHRSNTDVAEAIAKSKSSIHIVVYREQPLASYRGDIRGLAAPARKINSGIGAGKIDVHSASARAYVDYLATMQRRHESRIASLIGYSPQVSRRMRHALNASVLKMSPDDAQRVRGMPEVVMVEEYRIYDLDTDTGPALIGAPAVWNANPTGFKGEGVVFGILDTGINFGSPSFAATDEDGYTHVNPLGSGQYLGTCAAGEVDGGRCNDKLIGGYDFVCGAPAESCGEPGITDEPSFGDNNGHGSHTASTAAGAVRTAQYRGVALPISGVAPRGNVVAFDVCFVYAATGGGGCPNVASIAAVDQAIADGVVDVLNYSISGGTRPWDEAISLAFLNATDAGIYVATSGGNSGPDANTTGHIQPWTGSTAAATHGRGMLVFAMTVTAPAPVPEQLTAIVLSEANGSAPFNAPIPSTTPIRVSARIDTQDDGCAAFPADTFQGAIAVLRRGGCSFAVKGNNAAQAGAVAVVIANSEPGSMALTAPDVPIPVFGIAGTDGDGLRDFAASNGNTASGGIGYPAITLSNVPDVLASFSARGPARALNLIKPDITGPGVSVLAAYAGSTITGYESLTAIISGTSMSSPHHAGAAGLLRQAHPDWSVAEIKSALQMTAHRQVLKEDGSTPADPFAMGAGRLQVDRAIKSALVLDENKANYLAADPATGGDPATLNLASMANGSCYRRCDFLRTFRNPTDAAVDYQVRIDGLEGRVIPTRLRVPAGATRSLRIMVRPRHLPNDGSWHFGGVTLTPIGADHPALHLPVAVSVLPPAIAFTPPRLSVDAPSGSRSQADLQIDNVGGSLLEYITVSSGTGSQLVANAARENVNTGYRSTRFTDPASAGGVAQFASDDFVLAQTTKLRSLFTEGFTISGADLAQSATRITWSIFPDANGKPAGDPVTSPNRAVWRYSAAPGSAGVATTNRNIGLDLVAAGQELSLPAGRYWLVVNADSTFANSWVWFASDQSEPPLMIMSVSSDGVSSGWSQANDGFPGLSLRVVGEVACAAPWIGSPASGRRGIIEPEDSRIVSFPLDASDLAPGRYIGNLCVASNDPVVPRAALQVTFNVTCATRGRAADAGSSSLAKCNRP